MRNILSHCEGMVCNTIPGNSSLDTSDNIIHDWPPPGGSFLGETTGSYPAPERTISSYNASLGGEASFAAFAEQVRLQRKGNWRPAYSAQVVNEYFREGFGTNLDLGYTLPVHPWQVLDLQLAMRGEHFDPLLGHNNMPDSAVQLLSLGLNAIAGNVRASIFGTLTFLESPSSRERTQAGEITLRTAASF